jgi:predicted RNase H-like nuclease
MFIYIYVCIHKLIYIQYKGSPRDDVHPVISDNQVDLEDVYAEIDHDLVDVIPEVQGVVRRSSVTMRDKQSDLKGEAGDQVDQKTSSL